MFSSMCEYTLGVNVGDYNQGNSFFSTSIFFDLHLAAGSDASQFLSFLGSRYYRNLEFLIPTPALAYLHSFKVDIGGIFMSLQLEVIYKRYCITLLVIAFMSIQKNNASKASYAFPNSLLMYSVCASQLNDRFIDLSRGVLFFIKLQVLTLTRIHFPINVSITRSSRLRVHSLAQEARRTIFYEIVVISLAF